MKKLIKNLGFVLFILTSIGLVVFVVLFKTGNGSVEQYSQANYDEYWFYTGLDKVDEIEESDVKIRGGIVSHHIVASYMMVDLFQKLSSQEINRLIIIGPNHFESGEGNLISSKKNWKTEFGVIETDKEFIEELEFEINAGVIENDHAITELLVFARYFQKNFKVVPILISGIIDQNEIDEFVNLLSSKMSKDDVLIASIDFSHYLSSQVADDKDDTTLELIKSRDYEQIFRLNNDYIDSPGTLISFLKVMDKLGIANSQIVNRDNSGRILSSEWEETTSYFEMVFY
jgi:MEMO1 family protein